MQDKPLKGVVNHGALCHAGKRGSGEGDGREAPVWRRKDPPRSGRPSKTVGHTHCKILDKQYEML